MSRRISNGKDRKREQESDSDDAMNAGLVVDGCLRSIVATESRLFVDGFRTHQGSRCGVALR